MLSDLDERERRAVARDSKVVWPDHECPFTFRFGNSPPAPTLASVIRRRRTMDLPILYSHQPLTTLSEESEIRVTTDPPSNGKRAMSYNLVRPFR